MVKKTRGRKPNGDKGKKPISPQPAKRGRKSTKQLMEPLIQTFAAEIPNSIKSRIYGWETGALNNMDEEDARAFEDLQNVVADAGHIRGRISLFQHSIRTYWLMKCLLAKVVMSTQEIAESKLESTMADINRNQEINLRQLHQYARLGRMEKDIKELQQVEILGSRAKDLAPVESEDD